MEVKVIDFFTGKEVAQKKVSKLFAVKDIRFDLIKDVILWQQNKARSGNHKVKTISEISGTTAKPFRQKGTGNARQGSRRATQMRGGATVFGPVVRTHNTKLPKKIRRLGLINALAYRLKEDSIQLISEPKLKKPAAKEVAQKIDQQKNKNLFIYSKDTDKNFLLSTYNLKNSDNLAVEGANVYDIMNHDKIYVTDNAFEQIQQRLSNEG